MCIKMADPSFNVHGSAMAVLYLLSLREPTFAEYKDGRYILERITAPFYSGRERGVIVSYIRYDVEYKRQLNIVFGESRNSDNIFVDEWISDMTRNPPTLVDFGEEAYKRRRMFGYDEHRKVAEYIYGRVEEWYKKCGGKEAIQVKD
jgi:hypothetical protein